MKVFPFLLMICIFVFSCGFDKKDYRINNIQGKWVLDNSDLPIIESNRVISKIRDNCGFQFDKEVCHMNCSFYRKEKSNVYTGMKTGYSTPFKINNDSLKIWDTEKKEWHLYLVEKLTKDSLILFDYNMQYNLKYIRPITFNENESLYNQIIISKIFLGDRDERVDELFYIDRDDYFYYKNSRNEVASYKLDNKIVTSFFSNFRYLDLNKIKNEYIGGGTGSSVHYSISFLKNNKVIKRVIDHQNTGPDELLMGYVPMVSELREMPKSKSEINSEVKKMSEEEYNFFSKKMD
ncbi:hypothetical protein LZQ00_09235 [Sphingobacterium sp. SRCM116780]|uniref:hypothetical protein n=1 Tax=Sphingobacterium sp. SRCM116780 TaxID=2907623 RepID=UPI001F3B94D1|nr:hypothetical protein [Sphingobacterium sp. SRCM116780]UIR57984.1 hypothetical protein LZQ00_09235 [Sphingobacterium sp. SRCM116780]